MSRIGVGFNNYLVKHYLKDFYFLDELERKKLVKLAEKIDTELAIRDNKLEEIKNKLEDSGSDTGQSGNNMKMKKISALVVE